MILFDKLVNHFLHIYSTKQLHFVLLFDLSKSNSFYYIPFVFETHLLQQVFGCLRSKPNVYYLYFPIQQHGFNLTSRLLQHNSTMQKHVYHQLQQEQFCDQPPIIVAYSKQYPYITLCEKQSYRQHQNAPFKFNS